MNRILILVLVFGGLWAQMARGQGAPEEKPKSAVVNIQELFRDYYRTEEAEEQINRERARIQKENKVLIQRIRVLDDSLRELTQALQNGQLSENEREEIRREAGLRLQEREMLDRQREASIKEQHRELNQKMISRMKGILKEIRRVVRDHADREGFDMVFDVEGLNSVQVPFVLYAKDAVDLTAAIREELSRRGPAAE